MPSQGMHSVSRRPCNGNPEENRGKEYGREVQFLETRDEERGAVGRCGKDVAAIDRKRFGRSR